MQTFERIYATQDPIQGSRELYLLNMVFAIGCGVIVGEPVKTESSGDQSVENRSRCEPEEYHASAIVHLESCLSNSGGGLEVLQAVLLLANFALLRPVPPGLWYVLIDQIVHCKALLTNTGQVHYWCCCATRSRSWFAL